MNPSHAEWPGRRVAVLVASTAEPFWANDAPQPRCTRCAPMNDQPSVHPRSGSRPVLVTTTTVTKPPGHDASLRWRTEQAGAGGGAAAGPWSARKPETQASVEFQLIVSSLVDHDSM